MEREITYKKVRDHFEIFVNGEFEMSCDLNELQESIKEIKGE